MRTSVSVLWSQLVTLFLISLAISAGCSSTNEKPASPPPEVTVTTVIQKDVPVYQEWVGTMAGNVDADIRPKVDGFLISQLYKEGSYVEKGQPLYQLDKRQTQAAVEQAQGDLARTQASLHQAEIDVRRYADNLELILGDATVYPKRGHALFVNREVNTLTGTIQVRGEFPNPGNVLRPGQYARIRVTELRKNSLLIPRRAASELQGVYLVGVVAADNTATMKTVQLGPQFGDLWVVNPGLQIGDKVIVEGLQRVKNGMG